MWKHLPTPLATCNQSLSIYPLTNSKKVGIIDINDIDTLALAESFFNILKKKIKSGTELG
jgi:hypothetical protein